MFLESTGIATGRQKNLTSTLTIGTEPAVHESTEGPPYDRSNSNKDHAHDVDNEPCPIAHTELAFFVADVVSAADDEEKYWSCVRAVEDDRDTRHVSVKDYRGT